MVPVIVPWLDCANAHKPVRHSMATAKMDRINHPSRYFKREFKYPAQTRSGAIIFAGYVGVNPLALIVNTNQIDTVIWLSVRPIRLAIFTRGEPGLIQIAFSRCGSRGRLTGLETGVGGVKDRVLTHQLSCVALDLFL
jgi:hypothetical protein